MALTKLHEDLLHDFNEQRLLINEQIKIFDPLATSLRKPAAQRLLNTWLLLSLEILCYALCAGMIALAIFSHMLIPFRIISEIQYNAELNQKLGPQYVLIFTVIVYGMMALLSILFFIIGRTISAIRQKNNILDLAGRNMKVLVGQHLNRKAAIESLEARHFLSEEPQIMFMTPKVNEVPNPGYDAEE